MACSSFRVPTLMLGFVLASGMNIVNPTTGKCLDLVAPCVDGSHAKHCERVPVNSLREGANLQMFQCHGKANQQFELLSSGRLRNPVTGLCLDIQAPCKDARGEECERAAVGEIVDQANIQLWHCHSDVAPLSASYGNQKWTFRSNGELKNMGSGLCLEYRGFPDATTNVEVGLCSGGGHQTFDLENGGTAEQTKLGNTQRLVADSANMLFESNQAIPQRFWALCFGPAALLIIAISARQATNRAVSPVDALPLDCVE